MAPVATTENKQETTTVDLKARAAEKVFNPFYSPPATDENDGTYQFANYKVSLALPPTLLDLRI